MLSDTQTIEIAVVSRDTRLIDVLASALGPAYAVTAASDDSVAALTADRRRPDVVILDISSGGSETDPKAFLAELAVTQIPVVIMADDNARRRAMELSLSGPQLCVRKPPALPELKTALQRAWASRRAESATARMRTDTRPLTGMDQLVGGGIQMQQVYKLIRKVANLEASVLITGESGTGKELIARAIHNTGRRSARPFVAVSCGAIPDTLIEAELFGHEKGAFTGTVGAREGYLEKAGDGTLFLDEIGELNQETQVALLRVLQQKEFSRLGSSRLIPLRARIVFATHRNLSEMVAEGRFREDLYYRINVMNIKAPALRRHPEDIPTLAAHFVNRYTVTYDKTIEGIDPEALALLESHSWPGNIRELENVMQRAIIMAETETIQPSDLFEEEHGFPSGAGDPEGEDSGSNGTFERLLRGYKVRLANDAVENCHGNKTLAARSLSISRAYLHRLIRSSPSAVDEPQVEELTIRGRR